MLSHVYKVFNEIVISKSVFFVTFVYISAKSSKNKDKRITYPYCKKLYNMNAYGLITWQ